MALFFYLVLKIKKDNIQQLLELKLYFVKFKNSIKYKISSIDQ